MADVRVIEVAPLVTCDNIDVFLIGLASNIVLPEIPPYNQNDFLSSF